MICTRIQPWRLAAFIALAGVFPPALAASGDDAALRAQTTNWAKAYNAGDAAAVTAIYADDALLLPPGAPGAKGRAAILAFFKKDIADAQAAGVVLQIGPNTNVGVSGNMGWESGTYAATVKGAVVESGKFLSVSRKARGKWLYIRDTWNADAAPAPAAAPAKPAAAAPPMPAAPARK
ncbi:MAG: DUF4440 domain-containing protein [Casimicrobiaceae bacterium]